jgi:hypothetical protein
VGKIKVGNLPRVAVVGCYLFWGCGVSEKGAFHFAESLL